MFYAYDLILPAALAKTVFHSFEWTGTAPLWEVTSYSKANSRQSYHTKGVVGWTTRILPMHLIPEASCWNHRDSPSSPRIDRVKKESWSLEALHSIPVHLELFTYSANIYRVPTECQELLGTGTANKRKSLPSCWRRQSTNKSLLIIYAADKCNREKQKCITEIGRARDNENRYSGQGGQGMPLC